MEVSLLNHDVGDFDHEALKSRQIKPLTMNCGSRVEARRAYDIHPEIETAATNATLDKLPDCAFSLSALPYVCTTDDLLLGIGSQFQEGNPVYEGTEYVLYSGRSSVSRRP
jgi:hypothetical protein